MGLRASLSDVLLLLRYGTRHPSAVWIPGSPVPIQINPHDHRARHLIARRAVRGNVSTARRLWRDAVLHLQPDIALDVGTNYGECLFGLRYPPQTHAIGIEANPALMPLVLRTLSTHPDRDRIRVIHGLVSDTSGSQAVLHIDPGFSGTASAVARAEGRLTDERNVSTVTIDDLIEAHERHAGCSSIVIKMDIEGFEGVAMRGFHRLNTFEQALGVVEFDLEYLTNAPVDGQALLDMLLQRGVVMDSARGPRELRRVESLPELQALHTSNGGGIHTDLVFVSSLDVLPPGWIVRRGR